MANEPIKPYHYFRRLSDGDQIALDEIGHLWGRNGTPVAMWVFHKCLGQLSPEQALENMRKAAELLGYKYGGVVKDGPDNG